MIYQTAEQERFNCHAGGVRAGMLYVTTACGLPVTTGTKIVSVPVLNMRGLLNACPNCREKVAAKQKF